MEKKRKSKSENQLDLKSSFSAAKVQTGELAWDCENKERLKIYYCTYIILFDS